MVLPRTFNWVPITILQGVVQRPLMVFSRICIAQYPMSSQETFTVVSGGSARAENGSPSKPTMEMSSGTRRPKSFKARIAPMAMLSLLATMAEGSATPASRSSLVER